MDLCFDEFTLYVRFNLMFVFHDLTFAKNIHRIASLLLAKTVEWGTCTRKVNYWTIGLNNGNWLVTRKIFSRRNMPQTGLWLFTFGCTHVLVATLFNLSPIWAGHIISLKSFLSKIWLVWLWLAWEAGLALFVWLALHGHPKTHRIDQNTRLCFTLNCFVY